MEHVRAVVSSSVIIMISIVFYRGKVNFTRLLSIFLILSLSLSHTHTHTHFLTSRRRARARPRPRSLARVFLDPLPPDPAGSPLRPCATRPRSPRPHGALHSKFFAPPLGSLPRILPSDDPKDSGQRLRKEEEREWCWAKEREWWRARRGGKGAAARGLGSHPLGTRG